mmetsp:Transcript_50850/g.111348  ORF Transcript_50850/g.111348 Transcript_50850/m.111348 type:complete len:754 (-) Transcript_50850:73-2334(-)|eukprot:CAMPEP_0204266496 /NCGR_PEP_ID=MMETSP0468-20130131/10363_1 /ASSEMBLY_ACC=CAM_ASM_000383 /TAXON_ID=2969 /ORGANISM="Oxyrrhis marina" /LENGTH=753 /DNA_ID=CAMNT_0051241569 /DNA_START=88 /DNA_END=2349 /DNA_ORIENTATION=+
MSQLSNVSCAVAPEVADDTTLLGGFTFEVVALVATMIFLGLSRLSARCASTGALSGQVAKKYCWVEDDSCRSFSRPQDLVTALMARAASRDHSSVVDMFRQLRAMPGMPLKTGCEEAGVVCSELVVAVVQSSLREHAFDMRAVDQVLAVMQAQEIERTSEMYEALMRVFACKKMYKEALSIHDAMVADERFPSETTLSCLIAFASHANEPERAVQFFARLQEVVQPHIRAYMTVLGIHSRRGDVGASVEILHGMQKDCPDLVDVLIVNQVLTTCRNALDLRTTLEIMGHYKGQQVLDCISYNTALKTCAASADLQAAEEVFAMIPEGLASSVSHNTMMDAAVRAHNAPRAWSYLENMRSCGIAEDKYTISTMVRALNLEPSAERVRALLEMQKGLALDQRLLDSTFHALLEACSGTQDLDIRGEFYGAVEARSLGLSPGDYSILLRGLLGQGDAETAKAVMVAMCARGLRPSQELFAMLLESSVRQNREDLASAAFDAVINADFSPAWSMCVASWASYFSVLTRFGNNVSIVEAHQRMAATYQQRVALSVTLRAVADSSNIDKTMEIFEVLAAPDVPVDDALYNSLLVACLKEQQPDIALRLLAHQSEHNGPASSTTICTAVRIFGRCCRTAEAYRLVLDHQTRSPLDISICNALLKAYVTNRQTPRALELMDGLFADNRAKPDGQTYEILLTGCAHANSWGKAVGIVEHAAASGVRIPSSLMGKIRSQISSLRCSRALLTRLDDVWWTVDGQ